MAKYLQIFMIWTTLSVSMLIVHGSTGSASQIKTLTYDCKPNGTMDITVPNNHSLQIIGNSGCTNSTNGSGHIVLTNCKNKTQMIAVRHNKLLGGKLPIFSLLCEDFKYTITLNAIEMITISSPTSIPTKVSHTNEITMAIKKGDNSVTSAVIGDELSLVISAPRCRSRTSELIWRLTEEEKFCL